MVTSQQIKKEVLTPVKLLTSHIHYEGLEIQAGKVIFIPGYGVIRQVSMNYNLITNEDLIRWLKQFYKVKFLSIYKSLNIDFYISGYFKDISFRCPDNKNLCYLGFEIANSYSSRFLPYIIFGLYLPHKDLFVRSDIRILDLESRKVPLNEQDFNPELIKKCTDVILDNKFDNNIRLAYISLKSRLSKKYSSYFNNTFEAISTDKNSNSWYSYFCMIAYINKIWSIDAFESARNFQIKEFTDINKQLNKGVKNG